MSETFSMLSDVRGQAAAVEALRRLTAAGGPVPPLLFHGPEGVGKRTAALAFAAALVCREPSGTDGCGRCSSCRRVADAPLVTDLRARSTAQDSPRAYPDAGLVSIPGKKTRISVLQARDIAASLATRPFELPFRVYIVDPAEKMTLAAANALLKTLEEPPPYAVLVLISQSPWQLPITVRSRLRPLGFRPLSGSDIEELLIREGIPEDEAAARGLRGRGNLTRARDMDPDRERRTVEAWVQILERATEPRHAGALATAAAAELAGSPDEARHALALLLGIVRDLATADAGQELLYLSREQSERLAPHAQRLVGFAATKAVLIDQLRREADIFNRNPRLTLEGAVLALSGHLGPADLIIRD